MRRFVLCLSAMIAGLAGWGCETVSPDDTGIAVNDLQSSREVLTIPYEVLGAGVLVISLEFDESRKAKFLIDTGATQSALFRDRFSDGSFKPAIRNDVTVHGMTATGQRPAVVIPRFSIDERVFENVEVVLLDEPNKEAYQELQLDGLIGMDILEGYRLLVDADRKLLSLIPNSGPLVSVPGSWRHIQLQPNPYTVDDYGLHFFEMRVGNRLVPALFDTGSELNVINWDSLHFPQLRHMKRKMREKWVVAGAIGEFDPVSKIRVEGLRVGQKRWEERMFVIMNFKNLEILGVNEKPFVIAGANLFADNSFYVDFEKDVLLVRPESYDKNFIRQSGAGIVSTGY